MKRQKGGFEAPSLDDVVKVPSDHDYESFDQINGQHSMKAAIPNGYIEYPVRTRPGGSVFFFNFRLAKKMGLLAPDHPEEMTPALKDKILETFSLVIINEYDILNSVPIRKKDIRPHKYMATRYLQLQHPNKQGKTSGDGRGIWNGEITHLGTTWDVSSSGTGATCLSPAHAQTKKYFKTGDRNVGYGNGYNSVSDGLSAALMSEIFHQRGIETEQTLTIISFEGGSSINVRAGKNLLRPAHFFHQLKQGNYHGLKASVDYFIDRQIQNGDWPKGAAVTGKRRYEKLAEQMALTFSRITAQYESDYIFCWLDWDGDNILANGGIIDYGSVRQFGLYHHEYRYDDVDRMSTTIPEQKNKARYIVQNFAQIRDFLITGKKRNLRKFRKDALLDLFDRNFTHSLHSMLLKKLGLSEEQVAFVLNKAPKLVKKFKKHHAYFEEAKSSRGIFKTADGIASNAIFCMQDIQRELPKLLFQNPVPLDSKKFISIIQSSYAKKRDLKLTRYRQREIWNYQKRYLKIMAVVAKKFYKGKLDETFSQVMERAAVSNCKNRITGDGVLHVTSSLIRNQRHLSFEQRQNIIDLLVRHQVEQTEPQVKAHTKTGKIVLRNIKAIQNYREGF